MACYTCFSLKKVVLLLIKCTTFVNTLWLPCRGAGAVATDLGWLSNWLPCRGAGAVATEGLLTIRMLFCEELFRK